MHVLLRMHKQNSILIIEKANHYLYKEKNYLKFFFQYFKIIKIDLPYCFIIYFNILYNLDN